MATRILPTIALAATGVLLAGPVLAQQQERRNLTEQEVKRFFDTTEKDMTEAVRGGQSERLLEWTRKHVADEATFMISTEVYAGDRRKSFSVSTLDKKDMLRLGGLISGAANGVEGHRIQDYDLEMDVTRVDLIGADAAVVTGQVKESGKLAIGPKVSAAGDGSDKAGDRKGQSRPVTFEATGECRYLVHRGEEAGQLMLGMTTCQVRTRL
jgi:hypothetical protein